MVIYSKASSGKTDKGTSWENRNIVLHGKLDKATKVHIGRLYTTENRNFVQHRKQEYCTPLKTGILFNTENRNTVHHRKDEESAWPCIVAVVSL